MTDRETLVRLEEEVKLVRAASRRDRIIFGVIASVIGVLVIGGAGEPAQVSDEVRTKKLTVVDSKGVARAVIEVSERGAGLEVNNEKGEGRAQVMVANDGEPVISVADGPQKAQLRLPKQGPALVLFDEKGRQRGAFAYRSDVGPYFALVDSANKRQLQISMDQQATGAVAFLENGQPLFNLVANIDGASSLRFADSSSKTRFVAGVSAGGNPRVNVYDADGKKRATMGIEGDKPGFQFFDANDKVRGAFGIFNPEGDPLAATSCTMAIFDAKEALVWKVPVPK